MTNQEAKDMLNAMSGLIGIALLKEQCKELAEESETKPVNTLVENFRTAVNIACEAIDLMDGQLKIEKKEDGTE